jgi:hypothetical protein
MTEEKELVWRLARHGNMGICSALLHQLAFGIPMRDQRVTHYSWVVAVPATGFRMVDRS